MFRLQKYLPEYKPNKELVLPRIAREISFNKMSERPQLFQEELDLRRDCRINYDLVEKKVMTHVFLKDLPREKNPMSPLPSYLQATMTHDELEQSIMHKRSQYSISYPKLPENSSIYNETLRYSVA